MIYPSRKKVRRFAEGGGTASLFNNPGTYLGIQYVPTMADTPDLEGLQYLMQQEEAERLAKQEKLAKSQESFKSIFDTLKDVDGLTGESMALYNTIENQVSQYYQKYNTPEKMLSSEAIAEGARLQRSILPMVTALKNNKEIYQKQYEESKDVMSNVYFNNGLVYVPDPTTGRIKGVSYEEVRNGESDTRPLTVREIFDYKLNHAGIGELDFNINQYDRKETREYVTNHFKSIGSDTTSFEGGAEYKQALQQVGLDPTNLDVARFKMMIKSGEINANKLYQTMFSTFDSKARNAIVAQMIEDGEDPYQKVSIGKDEKGKEIEMLAMNAKIHQILTGEIAKSLDSAQSVSIDNSEEVASNRRESGGDSGDSTILSNLLDPRFGIQQLAQDFNMRNVATVDGVFSPYSPTPINGVTTLFHVPTQDQLETVLGRKPGLRPVSADQEVIFNGVPVRIGATSSSSSTEKPVKFWETPLTGNLKIQEIENLQGNAEKQATQEIWYALSDPSSLSQFRDEDGNPLTLKAIEKGGIDNVRLVKKSDFENEMATLGIPKEASEAVGGWDTTPVWDFGLFEDRVVLVKAEIPLNNASAFTDSKDAVSRAKMGQSEQRMNTANKSMEDFLNRSNKVKQDIYNFMNPSR